MRSKKYQKVKQKNTPSIEELAYGMADNTDDNKPVKVAKKKMSLVSKIKDVKTWKKIVALLVLLLIATGGAAYAFVNGNLNKVQRTKKIDTKELSCVDVDGYVNIALLGVDSRSMKKKNLKGHNTDCIIIASINTKTSDISLTSIYRDTYTKIADTGTYAKINSAYASGGAKASMKTINQMMDLNVSNYVLFNFKLVADVVDQVGGITVNVHDYEIDELNKYTKQTAHNIHQKKYKLVKKPGKQKLEGVQAVSYGRIRKGVGDDFKRTDRMRTVIKKVTNKMKKMGVSELLDIMNAVLPQFETNLSNNDMIGLAQRLAKFKITKSTGFPYNKSTGMYDGLSYVFPVDLKADVIKYHKQMFGQKDYEPTDIVN